MEELRMYILLRKDLNLGTGALITQACHATSLLVHQHSHLPQFQAYFKNPENLTKVSLQIPDGQTLKEIDDKLKNAGIEHCLWTEQPENIEACIVTRPCLKSEVDLILGKLKLWAYHFNNLRLLN